MNMELKRYFREIPNFLSFFISASFIVSLSPILIEMSKTFDSSPGRLNLVFTALTLGATTGRIASFLYRSKFNNFQLTITSYSLLAVLVIILSQASVLIIFYAAYFICGHLIGVIIVVAAENMLKSEVKNKDRLITIATSFFPVGAITTPRLVAILVKNGLDWQYLYYILLFMLAVMILLYATITRKQKYSQVASKEKLILRGIFTDKRKNIIFIITVLSILFYIMSEFLISNWAPTYFRLQEYIDVGQAGDMIVIFWASIIAGRALISPLTGKVKTEYIILVFALSGIISSLFLFLSHRPLMIYILTGISGLCLSSLFPLIFSRGSTIYKKGEGSLATMMFLSGGIGMALSSFISKTISNYSLILSVMMTAIYMGLLVVLTITYIVFLRNNRN